MDRGARQATVHGATKIQTRLSTQAAKTKERKTKISKRDTIKLKSFCTVKETIDKQKDNLLNGGKYLQMI